MTHRFKHLAKGLRRTRGEMNKTEAEYAALLEADSGVFCWRFEVVTFRISHPTSGQPATYTPDFQIQFTDNTICYDDVKSSGLDDPASIVRIKACAELFPEYRWRIAKKQLVRDGGGFKVTEV